ncbi:conserved hypothetical protein [Methanothermus fervidus DSM 2088]|uniref:Uncharacterized protein n=1 Tax=Methanothermus fervidus (strain ATCC 43054 / DSM 2088 / JCM 10308 / V24 S) TaxID=523846 RepID=E3GYN8_METFV|nr:hypothetical protein [Methanothermus fervidus]ADP77420.1 conserved hypothetical protein [Methanothermus fervidus DSM 2088]
MKKYDTGTAIFTALIIGIVFSFLFDKIFVLIIVGFLSTYLSKEKNSGIGATASLCLGMIYFFFHLIQIPEVPDWISRSLGPDFLTFSLSFMLICLLSMFLGGIGGFIGSSVRKNEK